MKYLKYFEALTTDEREVMKKIRLALNKYFYRTPNYIQTSVKKNLINNLINIKVHSGPKNNIVKKFTDVIEYIGIGRKITFYANVEQLNQLLEILNNKKVDEISELMSSVKKYNL